MAQRGPARCPVLCAKRRVPAKKSVPGVAIYIPMMVRNEEAILRRHLPTWAPLLSPDGCLVSGCPVSPLRCGTRHWSFFWPLAGAPTNPISRAQLTLPRNLGLFFLKVGQVDERSTDGSHLAFFDQEVISTDLLPLARRWVYQ